MTAALHPLQLMLLQAFALHLLEEQAHREAAKDAEEVEEKREVLAQSRGDAEDLVPVAPLCASAALREDDGAGNAQTVYYGYDGNGNVNTLVDTSGNTVGYYDYDPFGNLLAETGAWADYNPVRFSTKTHETAGSYGGRGLGLLYYGARFYSPEKGRWINRDPLGEAGGRNLYGFCHNDGINCADADGRLTYWTDGNNCYAYDPTFGLPKAYDVNQQIKKITDDGGYTQENGSKVTPNNVDNQPNQTLIVPQRPVPDVTFNRNLVPNQAVGLVILMGGTLLSDTSGQLGAGGSNTLTLTANGTMSPVWDTPSPGQMDLQLALAADARGVQDATPLILMVLPLLRAGLAGAMDLLGGLMDTAAESAPGLAKAAPDFVVSPDGVTFPVPKGATGPVPTNAPGFQYNGGLGGNGLAPGVTDVRFMEPNLQNPGGYVNYGARQANGGWQSVNPYTGQAIPSSSPW